MSLPLIAKILILSRNVAQKWYPLPSVETLIGFFFFFGGRERSRVTVEILEFRPVKFSNGKFSSRCWNKKLEMDTPFMTSCSKFMMKIMSTKLLFALFPFRTNEEKWKKASKYEKLPLCATNNLWIQRFSLFRENIVFFQFFRAVREVWQFCAVHRTNRLLLTVYLTSS